MCVKGGFEQSPQKIESFSVLSRQMHARMYVHTHTLTLMIPSTPQSLTVNQEGKRKLVLFSLQKRVAIIPVHFNWELTSEKEKKKGLYPGLIQILNPHPIQSYWKE